MTLSPKTFLLTMLALLFVVSLAPPANAGVISTVGLDLRCLCSPNALGQSFTAEDPYVTLSVEAGDANVHLHPDPWSITLDFLEGDGPRGTLLDSFIFTPAPGFGVALYTFDLSHIALTVGAQYSYILTSTGDRGLTTRTLDGSSVYAGGNAFTSTGADFGELGFAVTPVVLSTPGALAFVALGLFGLILRRRVA